MEDERIREQGKRIHDYVYWIATTVVAIVIPQIAQDRTDLMVLLYSIAAVLALLVWYIINAMHERNERTNSATVRQAVLIEEIHSGFKGLSTKVDKLTEAQQTTMRATLIHNAEKYIERGWITPEEFTSWYDMHDKYSGIGANGLIDTYRTKIAALPQKEI